MQSEKRSANDFKNDYQSFLTNGDKKRSTSHLFEDFLTNGDKKRSTSRLFEDFLTSGYKRSAHMKNFEDFMMTGLAKRQYLQNPQDFLDFISHNVKRMKSTNPNKRSNPQYEEFITMLKKSNNHPDLDHFITNSIKKRFAKDFEDFLTSGIKRSHDFENFLTSGVKRTVNFEDFLLSNNKRATNFEDFLTTGNKRYNFEDFMINNNKRNEIMNNLKGYLDKDNSLKVEKAKNSELIKHPENKKPEKLKSRRKRSAGFSWIPRHSTFGARNKKYIYHTAGGYLSSLMRKRPTFEEFLVGGVRKRIA